jgi:hypothetical protein
MAGIVSSCFSINVIGKSDNAVLVLKKGSRLHYCPAELGQRFPGKISLAPVKEAGPSRMLEKK